MNHINVYVKYSKEQMVNFHYRGDKISWELWAIEGSKNKGQLQRTVKGVYDTKYSNKTRRNSKETKVKLCTHWKKEQF